MELECLQVKIRKVRDEVKKNINIIDERDFRLSVFNKVINTCTAILKLASMYNHLYGEDNLYENLEKQEQHELALLDQFIKIAFVLETFMAIDQFFKEIYKVIKNDKQKKAIEGITQIIKALAKDGLIDTTNDNYEKFKCLKKIRNASHNNFVGDGGKMIYEAQEMVFQRITPLIEGSLQLVKQTIFKFEKKYPKESHKPILDPVANLEK